MVKKQETTKLPIIGGRDIVRLLVTTYGATQVLRYLNADLKKHIAKSNMFVAENNALGIAQTLSKMTELQEQIGIILGDYENSSEIDDKAENNLQ